MSARASLADDGKVALGEMPDFIHRGLRADGVRAQGQRHADL